MVYKFVIRYRSYVLVFIDRAIANFDANKRLCERLNDAEVDRKRGSRELIREQCVLA